MARTESASDERCRLPAANGVSTKPASRLEASSRLPNPTPKTPTALQRFVRALRSKSFSRRSLGPSEKRIVLGKPAELVLHPPPSETRSKSDLPPADVMDNATPVMTDATSGPATPDSTKTVPPPLLIRTDSLTLPSSIPLPLSPRDSPGSDDRSPVTSIFTAQLSPTTLDSPPLVSLPNDTVDMSEKPSDEHDPTPTATAPPITLANVVEEDEEEVAIREELRRRKGRFIEMVYLNGGSIGHSATPPLSAFDDEDDMESIQDRRLSLADAELTGHKAEARRMSLLEPIRRALSNAGAHHSKKPPQTTAFAPSSSLPSLTTASTAPSTGSTQSSHHHRRLSLKRGSRMGNGDLASVPQPSS